MRQTTSAWCVQRPVLLSRHTCSTTTSSRRPATAGIAATSARSRPRAVLSIHVVVAVRHRQHAHTVVARLVATAVNSAAALLLLLSLLGLSLLYQRRRGCENASGYRHTAATTAIMPRVTIAAIVMAVVSITSP